MQMSISFQEQNSLLSLFIPGGDVRLFFSRSKALS